MSWKILSFLSITHLHQKFVWPEKMSNFFLFGKQKYWDLDIKNTHLSESRKTVTYISISITHFQKNLTKHISDFSRFGNNDFRSSVNNLPWSFFSSVFGHNLVLFMNNERWMSLCCKGGVASCCLQDGGFQGVRGVVNPFVLSGPRGCRSTITRGEVSSVKLLRRLIRRSGRCFSLENNTLINWLL